MKQQDIAVIMVVGFISGVLSFFLSGTLFSSKIGQLTVSKIDPITTEFKQIDKQYFNEDSENPTPQIQIGDSSNDNPFNGNQ